MEPESSGNGMLDAEAFLQFTERLKGLRERVEGANVSSQQRARWQRKLIAVSDVGTRDLERATVQLNRFEVEVERSLGR